MIRGVPLDAVLAAATNIRPYLPITPLLESVVLNSIVGGRVLVKAENHQLTNTFKVRGAMNRIVCLTQQERDAGVVAFSSGNFGQGLAYAATALSTRSTIVMPADAPVAKRERAASYGARIVLSPIEEGINREVSAARVAATLAEEESLTLLHPFEDVDVIAGQGTVALEIAEQAAALPRRNSLPVAGSVAASLALASVGGAITSLSALYICCGGGGLTAGCAVAFAHSVPGCPIVPVEPVGFDGFNRSLLAGERVGVSEVSVSTADGDCTPDGVVRSEICDALQAPMPGERPWATAAAAGNVTRGAVVTDEEVRNAMSIAFDTLRIVLEPSGAIGIAALINASRDEAQHEALGLGEFARPDRAVSVVASGGNVAWEKFQSILGSGK